MPDPGIIETLEFLAGLTSVFCSGKLTGQKNARNNPIRAKMGWDIQISICYT